jgi:hypothetical protein
MPSPGANAYQASLGDVVIALPGFSGSSISNSSNMMTRLSIGIDAGWGALYPTTVSNCADGIETAYQGSIAPGWAGFCWMRALGKGIDNEIESWVASWEITAYRHNYAPTASSIYNSILNEINACGYSNSHAYPLAQAVADSFMQFFEQEAG